MMNFIFIPIDGPLRTYRGGVQPDEVTRLVHDSSSKICVLTMNYCTVVSSGVLRYADDDDGDSGYSFFFVIPIFVCYRYNMY